MQAIHADRRSTRQRRLLCAGLLVCFGLAWAVHAHEAAPASAEQLSIQVNNDRMTLAVAKVPQIYLYGPIDADASNRFAALMKSGKIPAGSDIYLNSPGGDLGASLALGRLFRSGSLTTHLGVPRRSSRQPAAPRAAQCLQACVYAYLGGLYRWAPTGNDRFGVPSPDGADAKAAGPGDLEAYLKEMGIRPDSITPKAATADGWLNADQMLMSGLANNGRMPTTATYRPMTGATSLSLSQVARDGEHRITLLCRPDGMTLTAYYMIGTERSRKIAARVTQSYFEIDQQPTPKSDRDSVAAVAQSLVFSHPVPVEQLSQLLAARSMGAWLADRGGAVRYGFAMELDSVRGNLKDYSNSCRQIAKMPGAQVPRS